MCLSWSFNILLKLLHSKEKAPRITMSCFHTFYPCSVSWYIFIFVYLDCDFLIQLFANFIFPSIPNDLAFFLFTVLFFYLFNKITQLLIPIMVIGNFLDSWRYSSQRPLPSFSNVLGSFLVPLENGHSRISIHFTSGLLPLFWVSYSPLS